jgi:hypothetical protein
MRLTIIVFICLLVNLTSCKAETKIPQVIDGLLEFSDGNLKVPITDNTTYHILETQHRVIVINEEKKGLPFSEYDIEYELLFYDFSGKEISRSNELFGHFDFFFSEEHKRIFAARILGRNVSYLFDLDGNIIKEIIHDNEAKEAGITVDSKYIWSVANKLRGIKEGEKPGNPYMPDIMPYNHIMIFDITTGNLYGEYSTTDIQLEIEIDKVNYIINLSRADLPG